MLKERIVAFAGVQGTGEIARFCCLGQAKKFISETKNSKLITQRERRSRTFRHDHDEGHRYCSCQEES